MTKISEVTRRDIKEIFGEGITIDIFYDTMTLKYYFCGRLCEVDFLERIFDLEVLRSLDRRYKNAKEDIAHHSLDGDYSYDWIFDDPRFDLMSCNDEEYLRFLCEIFHPAVRKEGADWHTFLEHVNYYLRTDGYELYPCEKISNKDKFSWRPYSPPGSTDDLPFSIRCRPHLKSNSHRFSIPLKVRRELLRCMDDYNETYRASDETGWNYDTTTIEDVFKRLQEYYIPKCYNQDGKFVETDVFENFIMKTAPKYIFDAIEIFSRCCSNADFTKRINIILNSHDICYELKDGQILNRLSHEILLNTDIAGPETGLTELVQESVRFMNDGNYQLAVEKVWDAFERLKSYFCSPSIDKKKSVEVILDRLSGDSAEYRNLFNNELREITDIGNRFRIRHHEVMKIEIPDDRYRRYFYKKCYSLISTILEFI